MRINLVTPFAEKDQAKALGARWDPTRKVWYIQDVKDLTPFMRWIPDLEAARAAPVAAGPAASSVRQPASARAATAGIVTGAAAGVVHCGCRVLPWEDCEHTRRPG